MKFAKSIFKTFLLSVLMVAQVHFAYAQSASILPPAKTQFLDSNGKPLTSGKVFSYIPSTTTAKTTWQDAAATTPNTNPVILDAAGRALILGSGSYRQIVKDRSDNIIWDAVTASPGGGGSSGNTADGNPVGAIIPWAGFVAPTNYLFTYGQEVSRTTYSVLLGQLTQIQSAICTSGNATLTAIADTSQLNVGAFVEGACLQAATTILSKTASTVTLNKTAIVSTTTDVTFFPWGNGNGITTFNIPDLRGTYLPGRNNMGGAASALLTNPNYIDPNSLNGGGGSQTHVLNLSNLPPYTPAGTFAANLVSGTAGSGQINNITTNSVGGAALQLYGVPSGGGSPITLAVTGSVSGAIVGTPQGGVSNAFAALPPSRTVNYAIKAIGNVNPITIGVTTLGGMTGDIACGSGVSCTGQTISAGLNNGLVPVQTIEQAGGSCGATDNGTIINAILAAAGPTYLYLSECFYNITTPIVNAKNKVVIVGQGRYTSGFNCIIPGGGTCFKNTGGAAELHGLTIRDLAFISTDTTNTKIAMNLIDSSEVLIYNVQCSGNPVLMGLKWTGNSNSTCLKTNGRDLSTFEQIQFQADINISLEDNPNVYLSTDHYVFRDIYLVGTSNSPCIKSAAVLTNLTFEGRNAWAVCNGGFKAVASPLYPANSWAEVAFNNIRFEQPTTAGTPDIDINPGATNLRGLNIFNTQLNAGGVKLRNVLNWNVVGGQASCNPNVNILDVNTTDDQGLWAGVRTEAACTMTPSSGTPMVKGQSDVNPTGSIVPSYARFYAAAPNMNFDASISSTGGYQAGSPTGGLKGAGTINLANDYYKNGTVIPETVSLPLTLSAAGLLACPTCVLVSGTAHGNSDYTILSTDRYVYTSAAFTAPRIWTLPAANSLAAGTTIWVQDAQNTVTSTNTLTVSRAGADTINIGSTTLLVTGAGGGITFTTDGVSNWGVPVQTVSSGGTGRQTLTSNAVVVGNGTSGVQSIGPGTTGQALLGVTSSAPAFGTVIVNVKRQSFCASGCVTTVAAGGTSTYTPSTGLVSAWVRCVGTGGGGGGVTGSAGAVVTAAGGGAGAYSDVILTAAQIGASKTVTNGTAGTGATAGNNAGTTGGDTSLGALCIAKGGAGGTFANTGVTVAPAAGGAGASGTGDVLASGAPSNGGYVSSVLTSTIYGAGLGASSIFGGGGLPGMVSGGSAVAGNAATQYGSGGGGASASNVAATAGGGTGSTGGVWIVEYVNQ